MAASAVSMMGLARTCAASITACSNATPALRCCSIKSTSSMLLRTMIPASAIIPIIEVAVNWAPSRAWPGITPMRVSGMGAMMMSGTR